MIAKYHLSGICYFEKHLALLLSVATSSKNQSGLKTKFPLSSLPPETYFEVMELMVSSCQII